MNNNRIHIKPMVDYDIDVRYDVANVFVDGYYKGLSFFTKDKVQIRNYCVI